MRCHVRTRWYCLESIIFRVNSLLLCVINQIELTAYRRIILISDWLQHFPAKSNKATLIKGACEAKTDAKQLKPTDKLAIGFGPQMQPNLTLSLPMGSLMVIVHSLSSRVVIKFKWFWYLFVSDYKNDSNKTINIFRLSIECDWVRQLWDRCWFAICLRFGFSLTVN